MDDVADVDANCNWTLSGGCKLCHAIETKFTDEDIFKKPSEDEIIRGDTAFLLNKPIDGDTCELQFKVCAKYKIFSISLACNAPKIEVFQGTNALVEYAETVYGEVMTDDEAEEAPLIIYRYDIEVQKSGIVEIHLKLVTSSDEICIFGIFLQIAANPNGITTLQPAPSINLENVQEMLNNSELKISQNAEMLKNFMASYMKQQQQLPNDLQPSLQLQPDLSHVALELKQSDVTSIEPSSSNIRNHMDTRLKELEVRIFERLDKMHAEYVAKLDKICNLLETSSDEK